MSTTNCCSFCEQLPRVAAPMRPGSGSKCPLCKQALWMSAAGVTSRLDPTAPTPRGHGRWLAGAAVCVALLAIGLTIGFMRLRPQPMADTTPIATIDGPRLINSPPPVVRRTHVEEPVAQVKPPIPAYAIKVKPAVKSKPAPVVVASAAVPARPAPVAVPVDLYAHADEDGLAIAQLATAPIVDLDRDYAQKNKKNLADFAQRIAAETAKDRDAFVRKLQKEQPELAGLPFLLGKACELKSDQAKSLAAESLRIRGVLADARTNDGKHANQTIYYHRRSGLEPDAGASRFWANYPRSPRPGSIAALHQILGAEGKYYRLGLTQRLTQLKDANASEVLANRAVFDVDVEVRASAIKALRGRPEAEYTDVLLKGLQHPWEPAAHHAAEAVAALKPKQMVPALVGMLDERDPNEPFEEKGKDGKVHVKVRELVRINHHRNCLLCHAPIDDDAARTARTLPLGPVPSMQESLPPSSSALYYSARRGVTLVRADITYLRQDFSIMQKVENHGKWPAMQRFDFLVRARDATPEELLRPKMTPEQSPYKQAILTALAGATGKLYGFDRQAWRREANAILIESLAPKTKKR